MDIASACQCRRHEKNRGLCYDDDNVAILMFHTVASLREI